MQKNICASVHAGKHLTFLDMPESLSELQKRQRVGLADVVHAYIHCKLADANLSVLYNNAEFV